MKGLMKAKVLVVIVLALAAAGAWAKPTAATSSGNWDDAIWNNGAPADGDDVGINSGVTVTLSSAPGYVLNSFTNSGTLVFTNWNTSLSATEIRLAAGTVTHAAIDAVAAPGVTNRVYLICSNLTIAAGATIDVYGKGFRGAPAVTTNINTTGQGPSPGSGNLGASHGGRGCQNGPSFSGTTYGLYNAPEMPGSGGGLAQGDGGSWGGLTFHGGGVVRIVATGNVTVDGKILADGQSNADSGSASGRTSGASGGSIYITCRTITGSGIINAKGGYAGDWTSSGGGGRIAVDVQDSAAQAALPRPTLKFYVHGGPRNVNGSNSGAGEEGTLFVTHSSILQEVWTNNATIYATNGTLSALTVSNATMNLRYPLLSVSGNVSLLTNAVLNVYAAPTNGTTAYGASLAVGGNLTLAGNAWLYPYSDNTNGGSVYFNVNNLYVATNCGFNANGLGYKGAPANVNTNGYGPGCGRYVGNNGAGGAGYGGAGANGQDGGAGGTYGSSNAPTQPGSGGGTTSQGGVAGGNGGGLIWIEVSKNAVIDGLLTANGTYASWGGGWRAGGGSGGGIFVKAKSVSGAGTLSAKGGYAAQSGGNGGGGRIAVWYTVNNFTGSTNVVGASGGSYGTGGNGTVVWQYVPPKGTAISIH